MKWELPDLPYDYGALEPHIDAKTMEIHHTKHHEAYRKKALDALGGDDSRSVEDVLKSPDLSAGLKNNAGGFYNHCIFWTILGPNSSKVPREKLSAAITKKFGSFEAFKKEFANAAATQFGSGWAWLVTDQGGDVRIIQRPNQDPPITGEGAGFPIIGLDVWEHAYYLKYQNRRPDYIEAFWNVVNWDEAEKRYLYR